MPDSSPTPPISVSSVVDQHVREILAVAEAAARDLQREVEEASVIRGTELRAAAERDAQAIRLAAQRQAADYLEDCRRRSEAFAVGRITRLQDLSDGLLARAEAIRGRLPEAEELHENLQDLVAALASAARAAATEAARPAIDLPPLVADADEPEAEAEADAPTSPPEQVREAARELPRLPRRPTQPAPPPPAPEDPSTA